MTAADVAILAGLIGLAWSITLWRWAYDAGLRAAWRAIREQERRGR